ncbi:fungal-specific transcription factor domain-containing protein [Aspergillus venezuelensis]
MPQTAKSRVRAGKACTRCHEKRIKCDAMQQMPCTRCVQDDHVDCVLRETKRGTYSRGAVREKRSKGLPQAAPDRHSVEHSVTEDAPAPEFNTVTPEGTGRVFPQSGGFQGVGLASESPRINTPPRTSLDTPSTYQDISWSAMFDHFLNNRENGNDWIDKCSITYLGESFPLAIVLGSLKDGTQPKLHHQGPPFPCAEANTPLQTPSAHMQPEDIEYLRAKGVFSLPEKAHLHVLVSVFLDHVYPLYPVVNREEFLRLYRNEQLSLLLIYAISLMAVTFAPQPILTSVGFLSRLEARLHFYKKAKALFDMGYETNKITVIQSTFFLSFYGGGPNTYWNFYSWVSTAVTIAEALGIHRSTMAIPNMRHQDKSLMRRLWWALVARDSICGTLVGRPFRIDLDQADADMLTLEDFAHDAPDAAEFFSNPSAHRFAQYQIETAHLSLIMREIIISRFYPGRQPVTAEDLHSRLTTWKAGLAPTLTWDADMPDPANPFSTSLSVQYSHHLILIYLGHMRGGERICSLDSHEVADIVDTAAHHITTVVCALVTNATSLTVPHELYHGIFLAQAAFYERMRSSDKTVARLGRSALSSCQVVLQAISDFWDCGTFIMQLFENLSRRCLEQQQQPQPPQPRAPETNGQDVRAVGQGVAQAPGPSPGMGGVGSVPAIDAGVYSALLGDDRWQGNPMLENLFDLPPDLLLPE